MVVSSTPTSSAPGAASARGAVSVPGAASRAGTRPVGTQPVMTRPAGTGPAGDLDLQVTLGNLTMKLPTDWALNVGGKVVLEAHPGAVDKDGTGPFQASLSLAQGVLTGGTGKADLALGTSQQAITARQETGYLALDKPAAVTIGGLAGVKFGGTFKRGGVELRSREYLLMMNNQVYHFTFTSLSSKWAGYQAVVDRSVATFVLQK